MMCRICTRSCYHLLCLHHQWEEWEEVTVVHHHHHHLIWLVWGCHQCHLLACHLPWALIDSKLEISFIHSFIQVGQILLGGTKHLPSIYSHSPLKLHVYFLPLSITCNSILYCFIHSLIYSFTYSFLQPFGSGVTVNSSLGCVSHLLLRLDCFMCSFPSNIVLLVVLSIRFTQIL